MQVKLTQQFFIGNTIGKLSLLMRPAYVPACLPACLRVIGNPEKHDFACVLSFPVHHPLLSLFSSPPLLRPSA